MENHGGIKDQLWCTYIGWSSKKGSLAAQNLAALESAIEWCLKFFDSRATITVEIPLSRVTVGMHIACIPPVIRNRRRAPNSLHLSLSAVIHDCRVWRRERHLRIAGSLSMGPIQLAYGQA